MASPPPLEGVFKRLYEKQKAAWDKEHAPPKERKRTGQYAKLPRDEQGRLLHCKRGHEMNEENIIYGTQLYKEKQYVKRTCKTCHREGERRRRASRIAREQASYTGEAVVLPDSSLAYPQPSYESANLVEGLVE